MLQMVHFMCKVRRWWPYSSLLFRQPRESLNGSIVEGIRKVLKLFVTFPVGPDCLGNPDEGLKGTTAIKFSHLFMIRLKNDV